MAIHIYGIKNCDTMKKAFSWLDVNGVNYVFHDYKKEGVNQNIIQTALNQHGWENVLNRRGTTWRNFSEESKECMNNENAVHVAQDNPSIIKRPLLVKEEAVYLGFSEETYAALASSSSTSF